MSTSPFTSEPSQLALAIHTVSTELGLALSNPQGEVNHQVWDLGRSLSTHLHLYLNEFIQPYRWTDLEFIAVAKGPGGFTGTRLGVVTARTLAQQLDIPLFAVSTLAAIAWSSYVNAVSTSWTVETIASGETTVWATQPRNCPDGVSSSDEVDIAVEMPAQRGELHTAIYTASTQQPLTVRLPDGVLSREKWQPILTSWPRPIRLVQVSGGLGQSVTALLALAQQDWQKGIRPSWADAFPFYGQSPV